MTAFSQKLAVAAALATTFFLAAPVSANQSSALVTTRHSMILCQPGFVLVCNKYGCHCQKAGGGN